MPGKRIWTAEEEIFITDNWNRLTKKELTAKLDCHVHTLNNKCYELGLPLKHITPIKPLHTNKHPKGELARALGISFEPLEKGVAEKVK